jgi:hypothetical protein
MTTILPVISDIQYPLHDRRALSAVANFVNDLGVDTACVGDEWDATSIGRWVKGRRGEYTGNLDKERNEVAQLLVDLRVTKLSRSNHTNTRLEAYLEGGAPALERLPELQYERFMRLDVNGIEFFRQPTQIAPGWYMGHGDEGSMIATAGGTALNIAKRLKRNYICGHTHKLGLQHDHAFLGGRRLQEVWGFEVGNLMDMKKATYLKAGMGNWQQGFGVLVIDGKDVHPIPVQIKPNGSFYFDGKTYRP